MSKPTDVKVKDVQLFFLPVTTRIPLKFGKETVTYVTCARAKVRVEDTQGNTAYGWGETPLSVTWVWPDTQLSYEERHEAIKLFCIKIAKELSGFACSGHPVEIGFRFQKEVLHGMLKEFNSNERKGKSPMPYLAALVCCSLFDIAVHDAFGILHNIPVYDTYNSNFMTDDLSAYITPAEKTNISFKNLFPADFLCYPRPDKLFAWHLVGGKDLLSKEELTGDEPNDGYPVLLDDWIKTDGLKCLKIKLTGLDADWDYERLVKVGEIAVENDVYWLTTDFNCTVTDPTYVNDILDRLMLEYPRYYAMILYVEQPFPYELEENKIEVHSVSARKPLFMDESAHDWELVKLGRELGWTGVALKTCKTQTGALFTLCWAKAHGMTLMVQDLTNPMLAQIPHVLLAAHAGTIMGVETNSMQFYPEASSIEAEVHPGIYKRRKGMIDLSTLSGPGFGYKVEKMKEREMFSQEY